MCVCVCARARADVLVGRCVCVRVCVCVCLVDPWKNALDTAATADFSLDRKRNEFINVDRQLHLLPSVDERMNESMNE